MCCHVSYHYASHIASVQLDVPERPPPAPLRIALWMWPCRKDAINQQRKNVCGSALKMWEFYFGPQLVSLCLRKSCCVESGVAQPPSAQLAVWMVPLGCQVCSEFGTVQVFCSCILFSLILGSWWLIVIPGGFCRVSYTLKNRPAPSLPLTSRSQIDLYLNPARFCQGSPSRPHSAAEGDLYSKERRRCRTIYNSNFRRANHYARDVIGPWGPALLKVAHCHIKKTSDSLVCWRGTWQSLFFFSPATPGCHQRKLIKLSPQGLRCRYFLS